MNINEETKQEWRERWEEREAWLARDEERRTDHRSRVRTAIVAIAAVAVVLTAIIVIDTRYVSAGFGPAHLIMLALSVCAAGVVGYEVFGLADRTSSKVARASGSIAFALIPLAVELCVNVLVYNFLRPVDFYTMRFIIASAVAVIPLVFASAFLVTLAITRSSDRRNLALGILFGLYAASALAVIPASFRWITFGSGTIGVLILLMVVVALADTGAYYVGRRLGRRQMAPQISPKKTWEGFIGGIACVLAVLSIPIFLLAIVASTPFGSYEEELPPRSQVFLTFTAVVFGLVILIAVLGTLGDLFASKVKRLAGVKDFGNLFPGHGGLLDRIDSLLPNLVLLPLIADAYQYGSPLR